MLEVFKLFIPNTERKESLHLCCLVLLVCWMLACKPLLILTSMFILKLNLLVSLIFFFFVILFPRQEKIQCNSD